MVIYPAYLKSTPSLLSEQRVWQLIHHSSQEMKVGRGNSENLKKTDDLQNE